MVMEELSFFSEMLLKKLKELLISCLQQFDGRDYSTLFVFAC